MKLSDLLDELRNNILADRSDSIDGDPDQLFTNAALVRYINEAQRRFAVRGLVIRDSTTSEVCDVTVVEGQTDYVLHSAIISVISARRSDTTTDLSRFGHSVFGSYNNANTIMWDPGTVNWPSGKTLAFSTDEQIGEDDDGTISAVTMRIYPVPDADHAGEIIKLRVIRKPLDELTINNLTAVPEIPIDHHLEMLDWAAYLALRIMDVDAGDVKRSELFRASFERSVAEAKNLVLRKIFAPQTWGFGSGGWSWGGC